MKKYILLSLAVAGLMSLPGCATDDDDDARVHTSTTTTEESRVHQPAASVTTETRAVRTY